jgi:hypothetical protein
MRALAIIFMTLITTQAFAAQNAGCERRVAAKILNINEVDRRLERLSAVSDAMGKVPTRDEVRALDRENSIYFHAYQMAESVCDGFDPIKKLPREDD